MENKRFLTAAEVFQLFGVDSHALDEMVERGDIQPLPDMGSFKYRSEDFAKLIQAGKLSPRTSAEMFQLDDEGDLPFLKLKKDEGPALDDISYIELDESALDDAADEPSEPISLKNAPAPTDTWFVDDAQPISLSSVTSGEIPVVPPAMDSGESSEFELMIDDSDEDESAPASDSNVRLVDDEGMISFEDSDVFHSGTDSDVRLEGPVTAPRQPAKSGGDSPVQLPGNASPGDSDVVMLSDAGMSTFDSADLHDSEISLAMPSAKKPDSDSDVRIAPAADSSDVIPSVEHSHNTDSDIVLVGFPGADVSDQSAAPSASNRAESDSDVTIVPAPETVVESKEASPPESDPFATILAAAPDSDLNLAGGVENVKAEMEATAEESVLDFPAIAEEPSQEFEIEPQAAADLSDFQDSNTEFELILDDGPEDVGDDSVTLHEADLAEFLKSEGIDATAEDEDELFDQTVVLDSSSDTIATVDSDIELASTAAPEEIVAADSGISLESEVKDDSGISLEAPVAEDSGISLETDKPDSGLSLAPEQTDSEIAFANLQEESGIRLEPIDPGSGIMLDQSSGDSGIMLEPSDSGIRLEASGDSGISIFSEDSGLSLEDDDLHATLLGKDASDFDAPVNQNSRTADLEVQDDNEVGLKDSAFDLSLKSSDNTIELSFDEDDESQMANTIVSPEKPKKPSEKKSLDLSDAFQMDEPIEVEDLDISEDLDAAGYEPDEEFVSIDDEVLDVDDEHFSSGVVAIPDDIEEVEEAVVAKGKKAAKPVPAKPKRPKSDEPEWGLAAVGPIIGSAVALLITTTVLWGGVSTMWSGAEAAGPAQMLISTLAGLSPW